MSETVYKVCWKSVVRSDGGGGVKCDPHIMASQVGGFGEGKEQNRGNGFHLDFKGLGGHSGHVQ